VIGLRAWCPRFRRCAIALLALLAACATSSQRFDHRASALGFASIGLQGEAFHHLAYVAGPLERSDTLHVYVEHDGTPWLDLTHPAVDPTPRVPLALELMARDAGPRLFLGRPCYFAPQPIAGSNCTPLIWTHRRYSPEVVASMVAALRRFLTLHPYRRVVLIGYSGGGTLAWLMAARVPETVEVVTVAANLDTDAWTSLHGYSPLDGSLNPTLMPPLAPGIAQRHFVGGRDRNVPPSIVYSFARRHAAARVVEVAEFDHECCWIERWPSLLE
jgi:pimeloyl-ACP methyl ester carboxylesterase